MKSRERDDIPTAEELLNETDSDSDGENDLDKEMREMLSAKPATGFDKYKHHELDLDEIDREMNSKFGHEEDREHERQRREVFEGSSSEEEEAYTKEGLMNEKSSSD